MIRTDWDAMRSAHRFLRTDDDDDRMKRNGEERWKTKMAKAYYDKLFKEYAIADLSRYRSGEIGLRWRTKREVISGKGEFVCAARRCDERHGLQSFEVNFGYKEDGVKKNALVKVRVCYDCAFKLNFKHKHSKVSEAHTSTEKHSRKKKRRRRRKSDEKKKKRSKKQERLPSESEEDTESGIS